MPFLILNSNILRYYVIGYVRCLQQIESCGVYWIAMATREMLRLFCNLNKKNRNSAAKHNII